MLPVTAGYPGDRSAKRAAESPVDDPSGGPQAGKFEPRDELSAYLSCMDGSEVKHIREALGQAMGREVSTARSRG
jgi:hypothetical protein